MWGFIDHVQVGLHTCELSVGERCSGSYLSMQCILCVHKMVFDTNTKELNRAH